jgi:DMSO/TMAO reductase YedYZ molybdopterin-dependent catalytic subunit
VFVAETPGGLVRWSIDTFGASQKTILVVGIVVTSLVLGAAGGLLSARRRFLDAALGFVAFGLLGGWAASRDSLSSGLRAWLAVALATAVGIGVLRLLVQPPALARRMFWVLGPSQVVAASRTGDEPSSGAQTPGRLGDGWERRWFLVASAGAAVYGVVGAGIGRALRQGRNVEGARTEVAAQLGDVAPPDVPPGVGTFDTSVPGISPMVTSNDDFYRIDTALVTPQVEPDDWTLRIHGMVDNERELTFDELLALPRIEEFITIACVSNEVGGDLVGNALWSGVPLADLLRQAGVQEGASQIVGRSVDGWTGGFPTEIALDGRPAMVAVAMNGEPLPIEHGFPARLMIPGLYGYVSATKWLSEIELTTWDAFDGYWIPRGWSKEGPIKTQSRIDTPRNRGALEAGRIPVAGVAWAPTREIARVEVRIDGGSWVEARLSGALSDNTWVQWLYEWDAEPGDHELEVRATDGTGETQTSEDASPAPSGATGYHSIEVHVE